MMGLLLGDGANGVRELERLSEVVEREDAPQALDPVGLDELPARDLRMKLRDLRVGNSRCVATASDTRLPSERLNHYCRAAVEPRTCSRGRNE